jgi:hypothetical protein
VGVNRQTAGAPAGASERSADGRML